MSKARLTKIGLRNFKSFGPEYQEIELSPLTVLLGRNNSGKSTIIQALLLLKQTLAHPRPEVRLHLEGDVDALNLRELTHGWPEGDIESFGPSIMLEWESLVDVEKALKKGDRSANRQKLSEQTGIHWLVDESGPVTFRTSMSLDFGTTESRICLLNARLSSKLLKSDGFVSNLPMIIERSGSEFVSEYLVHLDSGSLEADEVGLGFEHFLPFVQRAHRDSDEARVFLRAFRVLYEQPLEDLKMLLLRLSCVGSTRVLPPSVYRVSSTPPEDVGISGEYAAQLLHTRQYEVIHYLPLSGFMETKGRIDLPSTVVAGTLTEAVNRIFKELGTNAQFQIEDIKDIGFRLLFGKSSLQHVGRGISYLLPVVEAGLIMDPLRINHIGEEVPLAVYLQQCQTIAHGAMEEPEGHTHPKVQTLLARFLVSLALSGRQMIVETHSDHLVRRLRGLIARAAPGSESETWLRENVNIVEVEQDDEGVTRLKQSKLTPLGAIAEHWPADFMDEASNEERDIYFARMDKEAAAPEEYGQGTEFVEETDEEA